MKFIVAFSAFVALTVATPLPLLHKPALDYASQLQQILAAINSPSTNPSTAVLLLQMLAQLTGAQQPDISPVLVDDGIEIQPPFVSPELVEVPAPVPAASSPLVQIIINVRQPVASETPEAVPAPVPTPDEIQDDVEEQEPPVSDVIIVDDLPAPPVSGVIVADLPSPPSVPVEVADLPSAPFVPVQVADLPGVPHVPVQIADLPASPVLGVAVADLS